MVLFFLLLALGPRIASSGGLLSDGARYQQMIEHGVLANPHFAFLPLAAIFTPAVSAYEAGVLASWWAAVSGAALLSHAVGCRLGASGVSLALILLCCCPALLVQSTALEVHAVAFAMATLAFTLVLSRVPSRWRTRGAGLAGFLLVLGHFSSVLWLPALAWIAAGAPQPSAERKAARWLRARTCLAGGALGLAFVFLCGWWSTPLPGEELSPLRLYLRDWLSGAALPRESSLAERWMTEISGALGPLGPLALCGAALALQRGDRGAAGLALALCPGPLLALSIGAFESGAYLLPGLPAVIWLAVLALRELARAQRRARALLIGALLLDLAARCAWAGARELPRADLAAGDAGLHAWSASLAAELALPAGCDAAAFLASAALAWIAGRALAERERPRRGASRTGIAAVLVCLLLQASAIHASVLREPSRDQRELAALGRALTSVAGGYLLSVEPTANARAILELHTARGRLHFLPTCAYGLGEEAARAARTELEAQLGESCVSFPTDLLAPLVAARDEGAIAWIRAREAAGLAQRLPAPRFQSFALAPRWDPLAVAYAARAARELPAGARLVTCVPDVALRGTLAALHPQPFVDLSVDDLPAENADAPLALCDQGLGLALDLAAASGPVAQRLHALRARIARGDVARWRAADPAPRARADAFWESIRAGG